jgi:hypothetical protein
MDDKERRKRLFVFATFLLDCLAVSLLCTALGTDFWIVSRLKDLASDTSQLDSSSRNIIINRTTEWTARQTFTAKNRPGGFINFGLFHGFVRHNKGLGERQAELTSKFNKLLALFTQTKQQLPIHHVRALWCYIMQIISRQ